MIKTLVCIGIYLPSMLIAKAIGNLEFAWFLGIAAVTIYVLVSEKF